MIIADDITNRRRFAGAPPLRSLLVVFPRREDCSRSATGRRADHVSDPPVPTRPARRRGGHRHHQSRNLGPPPHGHPRRPLGLARHCARLPRPSAGEFPPARASSSTPNTSPSAPTCPPRGRTSSTSPTTPAGARMRSSASPGTKLTRPAASSGSRPRARRPWWGRFSRSRPPSPTRWPDGGHAATPRARSSSTVSSEINASYCL